MFAADRIEDLGVSEDTMRWVVVMKKTFHFKGFRTVFRRRFDQVSAGIESLVLSLYYDEELNLKEIGEVIGVSESRVSQILSQSMQRLRTKLSAWTNNE